MYELALFGGLALEGPKGPLSGRATQNRQLALLALLGTAGDAGLSRDKLLAYLFPESSEASARHSLTDAVYRLRKALGRDVLLGGAATLRLGPELIRCDVQAFELALAEGDPEKAAELYRGPFLDGFHLRESNEFEQWKDVEARRLASMCEGALETLASRAESAGDSVEAIRWWGRLVEHDPLSSRTALGLMRAQAAAGDPANAILYAQKHAELLRQELGVEPPEELLDLAERLRTTSQAPPAARARYRVTVPAAPGALVPRSLGKPSAGRWQSAGEPEGDSELRAKDGAIERTKVRASRRGRLMVAGIIGLSVVVGGLLAWLRSNRLDRWQIVVIPFEDRTGDPALEGLGRSTADWVTRRLQHELSGVMHVVANATVRDAMGAVTADSTAHRSDLPWLVGAGTKVNGTYWLEGGRVWIEANIVDTGSGTLLEALDTLSSVPDSTRALVAAVAERVVAAVAFRFDPRLEVRHGQHPPPSLAAFREVEEGLDDFFALRYRESLLHFDRALAMDSSYVEPMLHAVAAHIALGLQDPSEWRRADSLVAALEPRAGQLTPDERAELEWKKGTIHGDLELEYRGAVELERLRPMRGYQLGLSAVKTNRPAEAIEAMSKRASRSGSPSVTWAIERWPGYWGVYATAYHLAGRLNEALEVIERGRKLAPDNLIFINTEVEQRAALGRVGEVNDLIDRAFTLPDDPRLTPAMIPAHAALEYRAHGYPQAAGAALRRALEWLNSLPREKARTPVYRYDLARVLYWSGRLKEALPRFEELVREEPTDPNDLGFLGTTLARLGHRAEAREVAERLRALDIPYLHGLNTMYRARIAAVLGDSVEAVRRLRQAYEEGWSYAGPTSWGGAHAEPDYEGLRDYQPFVDLVRPHG